ncbi:MAG: hypothetical protein WCF08_07335 [Anaerolineaceae bacterium]
MPINPQRSPLDQPAMYQIMVQARLDDSWAEWFGGMTITAGQDETGQCATILTGLVADQVTLHGLLTRIRDLNLRLISVQRLNGSSGQAA